MYKIYLVVAIILTVHCLNAVSQNEEKNEADDDNTFVATDTWQVIKEGQKIPRGLHVRINLQTGLKEAKLLEEGNEDAEEKSELGAGILKQAALMEVKQSDEEVSHIRTKYKSYQTLKEELGEFAPKSDAEILTELIERYKNQSVNVNVNKILAILEDLEYLAHQYDNAIEFVNQNGFRDVIMKNLNGTHKEIVVGTLKLLGSLAQNNAKVQIHALESGAIQVVTRILYTNTAHEVKMTAAFALSCLLRRFPTAQITFMEFGGIEFIESLFAQQDTKLQVRLATFVNDLVQEYYESLKDVKNPDFAEKLRQYSVVNIIGRLETYNWCDHLNNVLLSILIENRYDHDSLEKVLNAIYNIANTCSHLMKAVISGIEEQYIELSRQEPEDEDYFKNMRKLCWDIISKLNRERAKNEEL